MITSSLLGWPPVTLGSVQQAPGTTSGLQNDSPVGAIATVAGHFLLGPDGAEPVVGGAGAALAEADGDSGAAVGWGVGAVTGGDGGLGEGGGEHAARTSIAAADGNAQRSARRESMDGS
jgi:hypothetical protein